MIYLVLRGGDCIEICKNMKELKEEKINQKEINKFDYLNLYIN